MDRAAIVQSLELVAECGDPAPLVYARVFELHPQMKQLFVRDTDGSIQGNMLSEVILAMLDMIDGDHYGSNLMRSEIVNHENLGVPPDVFVSFFTTVRDVFSDILGPNWSTRIDAAWSELLSRISRALQAQ